MVYRSAMMWIQFHTSQVLFVKQASEIAEEGRKIESESAEHLHYTKQCSVWPVALSKLM